VRAIYFENISFQKLKEFRFLLRNFKEIRRLTDPLHQMLAKGEIKSDRLKRLIKLKMPKEETSTPKNDELSQSTDYEGLMPFLDDVINEFELLIVWKKVAGCEDQIPEPQRGLDAHFDATNDKVNGIKKEMDAYLETIRQIINKQNDGRASKQLNQ